MTISEIEDIEIRLDEDRKDPLSPARTPNFPIHPTNDCLERRS